MNIIIVSDHGMTEISHRKKIVLPKNITSNKSIRIVGKGSLSLLYFKNAGVNMKKLKSSLELNKNLNVYTKNNMPKRFHFKSNHRVPDITLSPKLGYYITTKRQLVSGGTHGYDPRNKDMHGVFFGYGPNIKAAKIKSFENIHIYPFIAKILSIQPAKDIDGKITTLGSYTK